MKKIHQRFFWLLILLLPVQLGRHFWPEWSFVLGLRIDYLSPTLFLTDFLVILILFPWLWESRAKLLEVKPWLKEYWWILAIFIYLFLTSLLAQNPGAAVYKFVKIVELAFLAVYVAKTKPDLNRLTFFLSLAVIYSSLIASAQFLKQASLNGLFWWLGERTFTQSTPGIAQAIWQGQLFLRPYATFSHPNVLAGFILVSLILIDQFSQSKRLKQLALFLGSLTIIFSFSRTAWLAGLIALLVRAMINRKRLWLTILFFSLGLISLLYFGLRLSTEEAIVRRLELIQIASQMIGQAPLTGVGLNNFVVRLPEFWHHQTIYWLQPVHNLFFLLTAEIGLVGLIIFLWLLILTFKRRCSFSLVLLIILFLGFTDHYWLTLQQTQLLLSLVFGLSWAS